MTRVREDLGASLHLGDGRVLQPGDEVPEGVTVAGHALEVEKAKPSSGKRVDLKPQGDDAK